MDFLISKFLCFFLSFLILLNALFCKKITGTFLHPASIFNLVWFGFTFIPLVFVLEVPSNPFAIFYIYILSIFFSIPIFSFNWRAVLKRQVNWMNKFKILSKIPYFKLIGFTSFCSFILTILLMMENGFHISAFMSDFLSTSASFASKRGMEEIDFGIKGTLSVFFTYFSALVGGIYFYFSPTKKKKIFVYIYSNLPAVFVMLSQSSKIVFLISSILFISSNFLLMVIERKNLKLNFSYGVKISFIILLFLPILYIAFISREGYSELTDSASDIAKLKSTINSYFFGSIYAFSDFFTQYTGGISYSRYEIDTYNLGYYSYKPLFEFFGGTKVFPPGYYPDTFTYKDYLQTNIYTANRGFIQDFGLIGTCIIYFLFGFILNRVYYNLILVKNIWFNSTCYIIFVTFIFMSYLLNIFTARYIILVGFAFYVLLFLNGQSNKRYER